MNCKHCKMDTAIRNPSGFCDHLYYPDNDCEGCHQDTKQGWRERANNTFPCLNRDCDKEGTIAVRDKDGEWVQEQCEYCYTVRFPTLDDLEKEISLAVEGERKNWLRNEIEKLEGMKSSAIGDAITESEGTFEPSEKEIIEEQSWNQALTSIITRYKEELKVLESK